jgi:MFS transporter, FHS family, L-fucose permease
MAMVTTLFFMWGFLTSLNDILVPHLKSIFELNYTPVMFINSAFFGSYFIFAIPSGKLIEKIGYKKTMVAGLLVMALGALLFVPGIRHAFILPALCYIYIAYYGFRGSVPTDYRLTAEPSK